MSVSENRAVYVLTWENMQQPDRPQKRIYYGAEKTLFACRIARVRIQAQWHRLLVPRVNARYTYIACLARTYVYSTVIRVVTWRKDGWSDFNLYVRNQRPTKLIFYVCATRQFTAILGHAAKCILFSTKCRESHNCVVSCPNNTLFIGHALKFKKSTRSF